MALVASRVHQPWGSLLILARITEYYRSQRIVQTSGWRGIHTEEERYTKHIRDQNPGDGEVDLDMKKIKCSPRCQMAGLEHHVHKKCPQRSGCLVRHKKQKMEVKE